MSQKPVDPAFISIIFIMFIIGLVITTIGSFSEYWRLPGLMILACSLAGTLLLIATRQPYSPS